MDFRHDYADNAIEIRIHPKTTYISVTVSPDVPSSGNDAEDFVEFVRNCKIPTEDYKANAVARIEQVIKKGEHYGIL